MVEDNKKATLKAPAPETIKMGSHVQVNHLKKRGIVSKVLSNGRYRVTVGSLAIVCSANEIKAIEVDSKTATKQAKISLPKISAPPTTLDLHGCTVDDALRKLETWIDRAILAGLVRIKVIHGFGSGKVQKAVHHHLSELRAVASFKINPFNAGETDIFL